MDLRVRHIKDVGTIKGILTSFIDSIGDSVARIAYGWKDGPRDLVFGEEFWVVETTAGQTVGWYIIRPDPVHPFVWRLMGVFPQFQGLGVADLVTRECIKYCKERGYFGIMIQILAGNPYLIKFLQKVRSGAVRFLEAGRMMYPEDCYLFYLPISFDDIVIEKSDGGGWRLND
ncbi:MAG: GNAT family N-acetyltransferase [Candidatus Methanomethylicaceae archaeon]